jgi:phage tail-like protein
MPTRDANNATWYVLRYATDFTPRAPTPDDPAPPERIGPLFYDDDRHVLELLPQIAPGDEEGPPTGLAVDVDGEVYRVDPATGRLLVRRCDGSTRAVVCEPGVFATPAGLALDCRGLLYVADPVARRVVVVLPEDGSVRAVLGGGVLAGPVDVAVALSGCVYVADLPPSDSDPGSIVCFTAGMSPSGRFVPRNADGLPAVPRPIAVMVNDDGTLLVADARFPRLLHFSAAGLALGDLELTTLVRQLAGGDVSLDSPSGAYGKTLPRFYAGACAGSLPARDGGLRLVQVHRALRLLALRLNRDYLAEAVFLSAALDGKVPGTVWHKVEIDADLPEGCAVTIETATSDDPTAFLRTPVPPWEAPTDVDGRLAAFTSGSPRDQLVQSPPGRYLRLRVTLRSGPGGTPSLRWLRVLYPRVSYLDLLPRVYRRDPDGAIFLERFLALFERVFTGVENRYEAFLRELNPAAAPAGVIDWLAFLVDLTFDPSWPLAKRRALVGEAMSLYRARGTPAGIARFVEIYTGSRPTIREGFLSRPGRPAFLGAKGTVLGCGLALNAPDRSTVPDEALFRDYAHRFTVVIPLDDTCDADVVLPVVQRIVELNKPAHTDFVLTPAYPDARVGLQSTVGIDFVLGGRESGRTQLGGCPEPGAPGDAAGVLGVNAVLGERRPEYARPALREL